MFVAEASPLVAPAATSAPAVKGRVLFELPEPGR
jgi:hypothetical protein